MISTYYALLQLFVQQPLSLQAGVHVCCVHCLLCFSFLGLWSLAKAPVANEQTNASISIFFITLFNN